MGDAAFRTSNMIGSETYVALRPCPLSFLRQLIQEVLRLDFPRHRVLIGDADLAPLGSERFYG